MKMLIKLSLPHPIFNAAIKDGTAGQKIKRILEATKPESVYFLDQNNKRGAILIVEMKDASEIPALIEPWILLFEADISFTPLMTPDDLMRANLDELGKKWF